MSYSCTTGTGARRLKAVTQRELRKREGDDFSELQHTIKQLNGHAPRTRRDILSEASRLLRHLGEENANLRRQLSEMSAMQGSGGNSMDLPAPPAHTAPAYGPDSTQVPHIFPQIPALDAFMTPGTMPGADKLMRVAAEETPHSNNTHSHIQHYQN
ncbi:hypothetical protein EDD17DRAFT_1749826 [Pisolithus thermaeus]|nr:hypothetical protein EDD17DRAFT_1749826 [Pisolithus thermaeus]